MRKDFYINDRFLVKPDTNVVIDGKLSRISRLEPHVMRLLRMLAKQNGSIINKEELIGAIWPEDLNAEEELTAAISSLYKVLQDDKKDIIRIIPKKGYQLHASITNGDLDDLTREARHSSNAISQQKIQRWIMILSVAIVLLAIIFVLYNFTWE